MNEAFSLRPESARVAVFAAAVGLATFALTVPVAADQHVDVSGRLVRADGRPLDGGTVTIVSPSDSRSARSDRSGTFTLLGLHAAASATLSIQRPGYMPVGCSIQLLAGHAPHFRVVLVNHITNIGRTPNQNDCVQTDLNTTDIYDIN